MSRRGWILSGTALTLAGLFALLGWAVTQQQSQPIGAGVNREFGQVEVEMAPAADFVLTRRDGGSVRLSELRGQVVMVDFWASWCGPCRQEAEMLGRVYQSYAGQPVEFVGVNIWDTEEGVEEFLTEFNVPYPIGTDESGGILIDYGVRGIPEKFFISADGVIREKYVGPMPEEALTATLASLMAQGTAER